MFGFFFQNVEKLNNSLSFTVSKLKQNIFQINEQYYKSMFEIKQNLDLITVQVNQLFGFQSNKSSNSSLTKNYPIPLIFQRLRQVERRLEFANSRLPLILTQLVVMKNRSNRTDQFRILDQFTQTEFGLNNMRIGDLVTQGERDE